MVDGVQRQGKKLDIFQFEENNLAKLTEIEQVLDLDKPNEKGLCYVHIASDHGQLDILKTLLSRKANLCQLDANGENGVHWAARKSHLEVLEFLLSQGVSANIPNNNGDLPLHLAAKENNVEAVVLLCSHTDNINAKNENEETVLHYAAMRGYPDIVQCLIKAGADMNIIDKRGSSALHLALRKHNVSAAMMLLQENCSIDIVDSFGETPIHIVAREELLPLAQTLCAFGCKVEVPNKFGDFPLHLAARSGNTEIVRCLCLAGCNVDIMNKEGVVPEVVALAHGFDEIAELLRKLRNGHHEEYISQMIPSINSISKIKLKLFGHSGVGKSALVETLKCGYFTSWFRRSVGSMSPKISRHKKEDHGNKSSIELNSPGPGKANLRFETHLDTYSHGIEVQNVNISDIGDISIWEFSGHEAYFLLYDNFIGNTNCIHLVFFNLLDTYEIQLQQVIFWLAFLQARIAPQEPLGYCGKSAKPARVALIATHADVTSCHKVPTTGEYVSSEASSVLKIASEKFGNVFELHEFVFVLDVHVVGSPALKALKNYVSINKEKVTQGLPKSTGFLVSVCNELHHWRKINSHFPAVQWKKFTKLVHSDVNPLSGDDHMKELIQQLQIMGEVVYVSSYAYDLVILDCKWLCTSVLGYLLSQESLDQARVTGIYSFDDVQLLFPEADGQELLLILEALHLCIKCETDGETEYEFPCFNFVETLDGLWAPNCSQYNAYGGVRYYCKNKYLLPGLFPILQVYLRRSFQEHSDSENDLYQWYRGSKFCSGQIEGLLTIDPTGVGYEIKVRGPSSAKADCFYFLQDLVCLVEQMFSEVCPGISVERHILSSSQLKAHLKHVLAYPPARVMKVLLEDGVNGILTNEMTGVKESILYLCFFDAPEVLPGNRVGHFNIQLTKLKLPKLPQSQTLPTLSLPTTHRRLSLPPPETTEHHKISHHDDSMIPGEEYDHFHPTLLQSQHPSLVLIPDLHASHLPILCSQCLCAALDPPESMGRDWCMLGIVLGMTENLPNLDPGDNPVFSPTASILSNWVKQPDSTVGDLLKKLEELDHIDLIDTLLSILPMFCIFTNESKPSDKASVD